MKEAIARNDKQTQRFHGLSCRDFAIAFRGKSLVIIALIVGNKIYGNICFLSVFIRFSPETTVFRSFFFILGCYRRFGIAIITTQLKKRKHIQVVGIKFVTITIGSIVKWTLTDVN
jgi:hypothetical protein